MRWIGLALGIVLIWFVDQIFGWRHGSQWVIGAVFGFFIGALYVRIGRGEAAWHQRVALLEQEVAALKASPARDAERASAPASAPATSTPVAPPPATATATTTPPTELAAAPPLEPAAPPAFAAVADAGPDTMPMEAPPPPGAPAAGPAAALPADESSIAVTSSLGQSLLAWFTGGNAIVRIAVIVLFFGVAILLRYAVQNDYISLEMRVAGVALGGVVLAVLGWRLRDKRRTYALTLQGAGIGIVYITLFAAYRLYQLMPSALTFGLLIVLAATTALLAVLQNAMPLAMFGFGGGFLAPILASSGSGNHVALFGYYLLLNLAIAWIAARQAWKPLNLLGFVFTFTIGAAWGARAYTAAEFASTEPFLIAHFLLYLFISVQYTRRLVAANLAHATALPTVDAGLLFGVPIVAFGLQAAMVKDMPYALALSAAVMSGIYLAVGRWLWQVAGQRMLLLVEGLLALGLVFLILVTPLALDARWTGAAWALQGAGAVWLGLRQRRWWAAAIGLALQGLATLSFWRSFERADVHVFAEGWMLGSLVLAASAWCSALWLWRVQQAPRDTLPALTPPWRAGAQVAHGVMLVLALIHALAGLWVEIAELDLGGFYRAARATTLLAAFVVALELLHRPLRWPALRLCARVLLMLALLLPSARMLVRWTIGTTALWNHFMPWGLVCAAGLAALAAWLLVRSDRDGAPRSTGAEVAVLAWFAMLHAGACLYVTGAHLVARHEGWTPAAAIAAPTAIALWLIGRGTREAWPMAPHGTVLHQAVLRPWLVLLMLWSLVINAGSDASMAPLPYLPLLNPVDLGHALILLYGVALARAVPLPQPFFRTAAAALAFWWLNGVLVRTLHHWAGTPMWLGGALYDSTVQTGFTILWTVTACLTMWFATRRAQRTVWIAGAVLLGAVVVKLFLVDLSNVDTLARIVSFLGVGGLMLLIGYVSPLPPARAVPASPAEVRP